jgi:hypothetical protein
LVLLFFCADFFAVAQVEALLAEFGAGKENRCVLRDSF